LNQVEPVVLKEVPKRCHFRTVTCERRLPELGIHTGDHGRYAVITLHDTPFPFLTVNLLSHPMTTVEEVFLRQVIVHVAVSFELIQMGTPLDLEAFRSDVGEFFSLPLPHATWKNIRSAQNANLIQFLEHAVSARKTGLRRFT
jgi:hypothetical protein